MLVQGDVRPDAVSRVEQREVGVAARPSDVVQGGRPEGRLALDVVDANDDRTDGDHRITLATAGEPGALASAGLDGARIDAADGPARRGHLESSSLEEAG